MNFELWYKVLKFSSLGFGQKIEGINTLMNLEQLYLGKNKITRLENLDSLVNLKVLSIQVLTSELLIVRQIVKCETWFIYCHQAQQTCGAKKCYKLYLFLSLFLKSILFEPGLENTTSFFKVIYC